MNCQIYMDVYIAKVLLKYGHPIPKKPQLSLYKHREVIYGVKEQLTPEDDTTPPIDSQGTKLFQGILGNLLYYAREVDNKLLVGLSAIGSQQAAATQRTNEAIIKYWITAPLTPQMAFSIALATWSYVHILTQGSTMREREAADLDHTFYSLKTTPCPDGTDPC